MITLQMVTVQPLGLRPIVLLVRLGGVRWPIRNDRAAAVGVRLGGAG